MLHFGVGKPRSGKSYWTTANKKGGASLERELMNPDGRYIVTNLPLVMHELEAFMARRGRIIDAARRVTLLEHSQVRQFWRYRGGGYVRNVPSDPSEETELQLLQNDEIFQLTGDAMHKRGVLYILDEIHVYFPARGCTAKPPKGTGEWVFQYATQHGHFSDTILMITQSLSYVDKQFREMTQDYTFLENERLRQVRGFRKGAGFVARTFIFPPVLGTEDPDVIEEMPLDTEGYGKIYDTSGGAGISGGGAADKGAKVKGLPLKSIWFFALGGFTLLVAVLLFAKSTFHRWTMERLAKSKGDSVAVELPLGRSHSERLSKEETGASVTDRGRLMNASATAADFKSQDDPTAIQQSVVWSRLVVRGSQTYVYLTDGRVLTSPCRVSYDAAGVVDVIDLAGRHYRLSRAPALWTASANNFKEAGK